MKKLFECANRYVRESDWKDLALVKFCLFAMGIMAGISIPEGKRKYPFLIAGVVFIATYIPLMAKFGRVAVETFCPKEDQVKESDGKQLT